MPSNRNMVMAFMIALIGLLSVAVSVLGVELHHANALANSTPCLTAPAMAPDAPAGTGEAHLPSVSGDGQSDPTVTPTPVPLPQNGASDTAMAATSDYVRFLQSVDAKRIALQNQPKPTYPPASAATTTNPPSTQPTTQPAGSDSTTPSSAAIATPAAADVTGQWQGLIQTFRAQAAPDTCSMLAADYLTFLTDSELAASQSPQSDTSTLIDDATRTDGELARVCTANHLDKMFAIAYPGTPPAASVQ